MNKVRTRFAPSPTGYMHIGNLRTALYEFLIAKKNKGDFILRIEDTDQGRIIEDSIDIIYDTLKKCNLIHDEGPDISGPYKPYIQSERMKLGIYKEYALKLIELKGAHYCFCDQETIAKQKDNAKLTNSSLKFNDPCKHLSLDNINTKLKENTPYVIRQTINDQGTTSFNDIVYGTITVENNTLDESILIKSDGYPTYNFANIVDDHTMKITHVIRGNEYLSSTPKYNLIYQSFGWDIPIYIHCPPVMKDENNKLSKRNNDASFHDLLNKGYLPDAIINYLALLGWAPNTEQEIYTLKELIDVFDEKRIGSSGAIFDIDKLTWMNGIYLRKISCDEYYNLIKDYLKDSVSNKYNHYEISKILQPRINILNEIKESVDFFDNYNDINSELYINKKMKTDIEIAKRSLISIKGVLTNILNWNKEYIHDELINLANTLSLKNGQLLYPLRIALTNKEFTPGGGIEIAYILGKEETLYRLNKAINLLV